MTRLMNKSVTKVFVEQPQLHWVCLKTLKTLLTTFLAMTLDSVTKVILNCLSLCFSTFVLGTTRTVL